MPSDGLATQFVQNILEMIVGLYVWHDGNNLFIVLIMFYTCFYIYLNVLQYDND